MAGASIAVSGIKEAIANLKGIQGRTQHGHVFFQRAALRMHGNAVKHFQDQRGPNGPWAPWAASTVARREAGRGGNKILMDTGLLRASMLALLVFGGLIMFRTVAHDARIYTETVYAATHQYGDSTRHIPARPFLWIDEPTKEKIKDDFIPWLLGGVVK